MAKKDKIVVERIGENSGHPITTAPVPVRRALFMDNVPLTVYGNGTVVSSTVDRNGVNEQTFYKSNLSPSFMIKVKHDGVSKPDTLGVYRYRGEDDIVAYDKLKPGSEQYKNTVEKSSQYGIPLATYGEAYDNLEEVKRQVDGLQEGGEIPSNTAVSFLENLPYGRHNVDKHNKLVEMGKRFGNVIPGSVKPVPLPNKYQPAVPPVKMPMHQQDTSDIKPAPMPMYPGQSTDRMPVHKDDKFAIPQEMYQEGGNLPSDNQQQLFVAIITDMAKTLGVEPSQELAEAVMAAFENNDDSQGLLTLFTKTKDKFMNETGLFREGGKMIAFIEKFGCGGKKAPKKTPKKQEGGITNNPTARQARQALMDEKGMSRGGARQLQRQLMYQNMGQGMSRGDARAAAAGRMSEMANTSPVRAAIVGAASTPALNVQAPTMEANPQSLEANYDNFNFNTAFRRARQSGADTFEWRGKEYGTQLAGEGTRPAGGTGTRPNNPGAPSNPGTPGNRLDNWQNDFNRFVDRSQDLAHGAIDAVQGVGNKVYDTLQEGGRRVADGVQAGGNAIVDGMQTANRRIGDWAQDAGNRVFDAVQAGSNILGLRPAVVDGAIDKVQDAANRVYDGAQEIGTRVVDGVQNFGNRVYDGVQEGVRRFNDGVQNIGNRFIDGSQNMDRRVVDGVQQGVNNAIDNTQAGVRRIGQGIANGAQRAGAWLTQFGQRFNQ